MRSMYCAGIVLNAVGLAATASRASEPEPKTVSVCEVVRNPVQYNGKMVAMRGILRGTDEGAWLVGKHCKETLTSPGYVWSPIVWLTSPDSRFALHSVEFEKDEEAFEKMAGQVKREVKNPERDEVWVTCFGLLETWENIKTAVYTGGDGKPKPGGFGHLGAAPAQLIIKTVKDVVINDLGQKPLIKPFR